MDIHTITVHPANIKERETFQLEVMVLDTDQSRAKGFMQVSPFDAQIPYLFQWNHGGQRFIHNNKVLFNVKALPIGHKNQVEQCIDLKEGDPTVTVTRPCRYMIEIPEGLFDTVIIEPGDTILNLPSSI